MAYDDDSSSSVTGSLIGTGIGLGIVHVLTGPDHLSALATLSAVSDIWTSFFLGVRWGIGHSTGLLLVGTILIIHDISSSSNNNEQEEDDIDGTATATTKTVDVPDWLGQLCETLVGFFMLFLGVYGFIRAFKQRRQQYYEGRIPISSSSSDEEDHSTSENNNGVVDNAKENNPNKSFVGHHHHHNLLGAAATTTTKTYHDDPLETLSDLVSGGECYNDEPTTSATTLELEPAGESNRCDNGSGVGVGCGICNITKSIGSIFNYSRRLSAQSLAVFAGIIHGLAGPGGVLGVVPAIQLHNAWLATVYLGCFCIASTITMGCFAAFYGLLSSTLGEKTNLEFHIHCFSSALSILVGITWLILLSMGILDDVFP